MAPRYRVTLAKAEREDLEAINAGEKTSRIGRVKMQQEHEEGVTVRCRPGD